VGQVQQELLQLRDDAATAGHERRQLQQQISSLQQQRSEQGSMMQALQQQLAQLQEQLGLDRGTLSTMLRQHQEREQQLQEVGASWLEGCAMLAGMRWAHVLLCSSASALYRCS
jgi:chromosome segregation ATPase